MHIYNLTNNYIKNSEHGGGHLFVSVEFAMSEDDD